MSRDRHQKKPSSPALEAFNEAIEEEMQKARSMGRPIDRTKAAINVNKRSPQLVEAVRDEANH